MARTYGIKRAKENANLTGGQIRANKCQQSRARSAHTKAENIAINAERKKKWDALTPAQKLVELDRRLGKGVGAKKQRAKLCTISADVL